MGWYTQAGGGTAVGAGDTVTAEATRTLYAHWEEESPSKTLPDIDDDSKVAAVFADAADPNLAANIRTAAIYGDFREWTLALKDSDGEPVTAVAVLASPHAWASYALGSKTLFGNTPAIRIAGLAVGAAEADTKAKSMHSGTIMVRVLVQDGDTIAAVDAPKVAALFRASSNFRDWNVVPFAEMIGMDGTGSMTFTVQIGNGTLPAAFLGIRESNPSL